MCWKEISIALLSLLVFDAFYLGFTKGIWDLQVASVQRVAMQPRILGAVVCYLLLTGGLWYFILRDRRTIGEAMLLGFVIYGVFDSTNYAIFKKWHWRNAVMDAMWGGVLFGLTTYVVYRFSSK